MKVVLIKSILIAVIGASAFAGEREKPIFRGGTIGNGGNVDLDELREYQRLVVTGIKAERPLFEKIFSEQDPERSFDDIIRALEEVKLYPSTMLDQMTKKDGSLIIYDDVFAVARDKIFMIGGEKRKAINVRADGMALAIFDIKDLTDLDGRFNAKAKLIGHELLGAVGLESTNENHIARHFEHFADHYLVHVDGPVPVVPLWSRRYSAKFNLGFETLSSCQSLSAQQAFKEAIARLCKEHLPTQKPSPYFSYECGFEGRVSQQVDREWRTTDIRTTAWVPGVRSALHSRREERASYYYQNDWFKTIYRLSETDEQFYRPGYLKETHQRITQPVHFTTCKLEGRIILSGIDPITADREPKLLMSSDKENDWSGVVAITQPDPQGWIANVCARERLKVRKDFYNHSHCTVRQNENKTWTWEIWGVHPYRSNY